MEETQWTQRLQQYNTITVKECTPEIFTNKKMSGEIAKALLSVKQNIANTVKVSSDGGSEIGNYVEIE